MRQRAWMLTLLVAVFATSGFEVGLAAPDDGKAPAAAQVVVRGKKELAEALEAATRPAWAGDDARPVLLVLDVTPNTQRARTEIEEAWSKLESKANRVPSWSAAALGGKPSKSVRSPQALGTHLGRILKKETDVVSTLTALRKTLKGWREKEGVVVYLADWHFEDDVDLEGFIKDLRKKGRTLSVVGTEAAFGRGWNDGLRDLGERIEMDKRGIAFEDYWEGIGRDPIGGRDKKTPWHGGEIGVPVIPTRWDRALWMTVFRESDFDLTDIGEVLEDIGESLENTRRLTEIFERLMEIEDEIERLDIRIRDLDPCPERSGLEARRDALEEEAAALEKERDAALEELPGGDDPGAGTGASREALEAQLEKTNDELGEIVMKLIDADDPAETKRLEKRQEELQAEVDRIAKEIEDLDRARDRAFEELPDPTDLPDPEELGRRLPGASEDDEEVDPPWVDPELVYREFPLPSTFGPYGLMRAAGVTGGRYVLFSWNPGGRRNVVLEYSRCNLFPPDLRARKAIVADLKSNPWASATLRAWWAVLEARTEILEQLPPLRPNLRSSLPMDRQEGFSLGASIWSSAGEMKQHLKQIEKSKGAVDNALRILDAGIENGGEPGDDLEQRYQAEALLFRHALRVARLELDEMIRAAGRIPRSAWRTRDDQGVVRRTWLRAGRDPEKIRFDAKRAPANMTAAQAIVEERKALLARFRGTPFGEQIALNPVDTYEPTTFERVDRGPDTGRSPTESVDLPKPTPKPPGGGSGGGGPTTGGG